MFRVINFNKVISAPINVIPLNKFFTRQLIERKFGRYNIVKPGIVSDQLRVPDYIKTPCYYENGEPPASPKYIEIKTKEQIRKMRKSCQLAKFILEQVGQKIKVGITTDEIDKLVYDLSIKNNAYPSPLNYQDFPKSVCTSVNNVACHGIPDDRPLEDGDIINVDITVYLNGFHGDCSETFLVGNVDEEGRRLVNATRDALYKGISVCKTGVRFQSIGAVIETFAKENNYSIVDIFLGHGIGSYFHGPPDIYHISNDYPGEMRPGMTFTIEPILSQGETGEVVFLEDNWTAVTVDNARTAQWEHTVHITENGVEILTV